MSTPHPDLDPAARPVDAAAAPRPGAQTPARDQDESAVPARDGAADGPAATDASGVVTGADADVADCDPQDTDPADPVAGPGRPHAFLLYNAARLGMLVVAFGLFYLVGFRGIALLIVAFLVSGAVSYLVLYRLRGEATSGLVLAYRRVNDRIEERAGREDDDD